MKSHGCNYWKIGLPVARAVAGGLAVWFAGSALAGPLRVAAFRCDVTPGPGAALVWTARLVKVEDPLLAKGIVLEDGASRYVLCAMDWCLLCNDSELAFREALAQAEGGYEPSASNVGKGAEAVLKKAIEALLGGPAAGQP